MSDNLNFDSFDDALSMEEKKDTQEENSEQTVDIKDEASSEKKEESNEEKNKSSEKQSFEDVSMTKSKNKAPMLNRSMILGISIAVFALIFLFVFFNIDSKGKKKKDEKIDMAGRVYVPDFDKMAEDNYLSAIKDEQVPNLDDDTAFENKEPSMEEINKKLETMNEVGQAPVYKEQEQYSKGGYSGKRRPDTRDNRIQKNISGIKGITNGQGNQNESQNLLPEYVKEYMNNGNNYSVDTILKSQGMSGFFMNNKSQTENEQNFYNKDLGGNDQGQFLPSMSLWQGTIIPSILLSGIDTSLPGAIVARVTKNVYSSLDGKFLLIPQGTLLFAEYNSSVGYAQKRVQIGWTAMIRPDGLFVKLNNMPAIDNQGYAGIRGRVNTHFWQFLKGLFLVSAISVLDTDVNKSAKSFTDEYSQGIVNRLEKPYQSIQDKVIDKALNIDPSIYVRPGFELNILVNQTLILPPLPVPAVTQKYRRR